MSTKAQKLSDLAKAVELDEIVLLSKELRHKRKLQKRQLGRIVTFFIWANSCLGGLVALFAAIEHFHQVPNPIITEKVLIAVVSGLTVQVGAIIIAAFKGLFTESKKKGRR